MEKMLTFESILPFLEAPRVAYFSTIDRQGYPHTVPVWFIVDEGCLVFSVRKKSARVRHIQANPKGAVAIGGNRGETEGYMIQGEFRIEDDPDNAWRDKVMSHYYSGEKLAQYLAQLGPEPGERLVFRLIPQKIIRVH